MRLLRSSMCKMPFCVYLKSEEVKEQEQEQEKQPMAEQCIHKR